MKAFILDHWKVLGMGFLALVVTGLLASQDYKIKTLKQQRDEAWTSLASYQAALAAMQADTAAKIGALEAEGGRQVVRIVNQERLLGKVEGAHDEKDGLIAPVLRDAIDGLYRADAARKADKAGHTAKPPVLRGRASTAQP